MAGVGRLISEAASGEYGLDGNTLFSEGRTVFFQYCILRGRCLGFQELAVFQVIGVLHISCRVVLRDIYRLEAFIVGDHLRIILYSKAH